MSKDFIKDTNFNMRINRKKKEDLRFNHETEAAMQEARKILDGKADAKSYSW